MMTTAKDYLAGIAFALCSQLVCVGLVSAFAAFAPIIWIPISLFFVPVYFFCKQKRSLRFGITVFVTHLIPLLYVIIFDVLFDDMGLFYVIAIFLAYLYVFLIPLFIPPVIDFIITGSKAFYNWLGERESQR